MSIPSSSPSSVGQSEGLMDKNGDKSRSSAAPPINDSDDARYTNVTLTVPKEIQDSISAISSTLDKVVPVERRQFVPIVVVVCVETAFLKWIRRSNQDVLSTIFFTILLGSFAWPVWSNLKRVHCRLDDVFGKIEALQQSIKALESTATLRRSTDDVQVPTVPSGPFPQPKEDPTSQLNVKPIAKSIDAQPEKPVERLVATDEVLHPPYKIPAMPEPVKPPAVVENPPPPRSPGPRVIDRGSGIQLEGMDNIIESDSNPGTASGSAEQPTTIEHGLSRWLPALREIRSRIEQFTQGRVERISHLDQSKPSILLSLRRWGVRLLMSAASLSPANFAPSIGYLGPSESTPYYPTGDLRGDRGIAFTTTMNCLDDLEVEPQGNDDHIATKLFELAQALSDLGLYEYALNTSGYALEILERLYIAEPNKSRLRVASAQSLRANILCDLKRNDEARDAADRAVTLCKEHNNSQAAPVPDLAYALLNYAVLLCSMGLNDESAAVAFELLCEDESQPDMVDVFALCRLCLSTPRVGADDGMDMEMAEQTIELTRTSSDANSQTVLAGALLAKSKILSSGGQNDVASATSAEAVTLLRSMSAARPVFSLFLAHALDTHAHHLSEAMRKGESYSVRQDAVELWQRLKTTAGGAVARPLAWSLFHLSAFRSKDDDKKARREQLRLAESAVDVFRQVVPLDGPGLGDALFSVAARMLELDDNREAATYAEESIQYFREALAVDPKYANDLVASLSLASSCLACTERGDDAFEYAKQAVEVQHERKGERDEQYNGLLRKLLLDVVARATEIDKGVEAFPWFQELQALGGLGDSAGPPGSSMFQGMRTATPVASSSTSSAGRGNPLFEPSTLGRRLPQEEIISPGAAAQRRLAGLGQTGPPQGNMFGGNPGGGDMLSGLLGAMGGGRGMGGSGMGSGMGSPGNSNPFSGMNTGRGRGGPGMGSGMGGLGGSDMFGGLLGMGRGGGMGAGPGMGSGSGTRGPVGGSGIPGLGMGGLGMGGGMDGLGSGMGIGMGGLGIGGGGAMRTPGSPGPSGSRPGPGPGRMRGMGGLGGLEEMGGLGSGLDDITEGLLSNLSRLGPDAFKDGSGDDGDSKNDHVNGDSSAQGGDNSRSPTPRTGTWTGMGMQSNLTDEEGA